MKTHLKCHHQCVNTEFAAECICHEGFELSDDGINCVDFDECQVNNGGCEDRCVNLQPSYKCACLGDKMLAQDQFRKRYLTKNRTGRFVRRPDSGLVRSSKDLLSFIKLHPKSMSTGRPGRLQSGRNLCSKLWRNLSLPMSTGISKEHSRNLWRHRWMSNR